MAVPLTTLREVKCSYDKCANSFDTEDEMKRHKYNTHEFYCKKCDYDGLEWDDSLAHKVDDMIPWLVGEKKNNKKKFFKHIVCEFCGEEFRSLGGRDIHKNRMHQADQQIKCEGSARLWNPKIGAYEVETCPMVFGRASQYVRHITEGHCQFIKRCELENERQQKLIVREIMKNPDKFSSNLRGNEIFLTDDERQDLLRKIDIEDNDHEVGGVRLGPMDNDNISEVTSFGSLKPDKITTDIPDMDVPISRKVMDTTGKGISSLSISTVFGSHHTLPSTSSTTATTDTASNNPVLGMGAWSTSSNSSKALFPNAKVPDWGAIQSSHERSQREDGKANLFNSRFWDPSHSDWDPNLFRDATTGNFACPFPDCGSSYESRHDIASHFRTCHIDHKKQCKCCYRIFRDLPALIQHYESSSRGGKCRVARNGDYLKILDEATGGFLTGQKVVEAKIWGLKTAETQGVDAIEQKKTIWERPDGIRSYDYKAQLPARVAEANM